MLQPRWIGAGAVVLLVVSVITAVLRLPAGEEPATPVAVPAAEDATPTPDATATAPITPFPTATMQATPTTDASERSPSPTGTTDEPTETEATAEPLTLEPWEPAPAGLYRFATDGTSGVDSEQHRLPDQTTLRISDPGRDGFQARVRDLRDGDGYGQILAYDLHVREDGIELSRITTSTRLRFLGGVSDTRTFGADPPGPLLTTDTIVGSSHQFTMYSGATTITVTITIDGMEQVSVDDRDVDAIAVTKHLQFDGDIEGTTIARSLLRPGDLLLLAEQIDADLTMQGVRHVTQYTAELTSLVPA